jgi:hypothetical protein
MVKALRSIPLVALLVPSLAMAQASLGVRAGYAMPLGDAYDLPGQGTIKQKDFSKGAVPLQLDLAWRFTPALSAGVYYSYGFGRTGSGLEELCSAPGASCDRPAFQRLGLAVTYRFEAMAGVAPWASLGAGWELASFKVKRAVLQGLPSPVDLVVDLHGWNVNLQGGVDWRLTPSFAVGPYLQVDASQYTVEHVTLAGTTIASGGVDSAKLHEWITVGLRGVFDL